MYPKTNYILYLKDFLGINASGEGLVPESRHKYPNLITNPILSSLIKVYNPKLLNSNVTSSSRGNIDMAYSRLVGHTINYLKPELERNPNYKDEVKRKLLSSKFGPFYTVFGELFVGGYLKNIGFDTNFNSSKESGQPDIVTTNDPIIANEVKTYPDREAWLEDTLASLMPDFIKILSQISNIYLFVFVSGVKGFKKGVIPAVKEYLRTRKDVKTDYCWIINVGNIYNGDEGLLISNSERNAHIRFKINFDSYKDTLSLFEKSLKQYETAKHAGITWLLFPHPKPMSLERRLVSLASDIPTKMQNRGAGVVLFEVFPTTRNNFREWGIQSGADFILTQEQALKINNKSFNDFINFLLSKPTLLV